MTLPIVLAAIALKLATDTALDYLYPDSFADGTLPTTPISPYAPYVPPFTGGQCSTLQYRVNYRITTPEGTLVAQGQITLNGAIGGFRDIAANPNSGTYLVSGIGNQYGEALNYVTNYRGGINTIVSVEPVTGVDNCGNLPNPNPNPNPNPVSDGSPPQNLTPAITPTDTLVEGGLPVVFVPSALSALAGFAAQLGAAIANAQAAADTLAAIKATADAVDKLAKMLDAHKETLDKLRKYLNKKEKEDEANKTYLIRQYGTILRDGYLDLTPRPAPQGFKPLMLDFLCANVPNGLGRFFGRDSYNWFRYQELGSICFLSPTSGVLSVHKIEHVRTSIPIPDLAIGFTYNMGLNGIIRARVSMLYTQEKS